MMTRLRSIAFGTFLSLVIFSCGEDELPKSTIEFDQDQHDGGELSILESNGTVTSFHPLLYQDDSGNTGTGVEYQIEINLNRSAAETTVIRFSTSGSATRSTATELGDFDILTDGDLVVIEKGEQSATLDLVIYEDYDFEIESGTDLFEMFTIELEEVVAGTGKLGEFTTFDVYIYEDDPIVFLSWDPLDITGTDGGGVDMDLLVWLNEEQLTASASPGDTYEGISLPAGFPNAQYGFSYTYYSGSSNNLEFYVDIINLGGNLNGSPDSKAYTKVYTQANINEYDVSGMSPIIVQTMNKSGLNYTNLTDIAVPSSGSRVATGNMTIEKGKTGRYPINVLDRKTIEKLKLARKL
jgi:hypothetical protein